MKNYVRNPCLSLSFPSDRRWAWPQNGRRGLQDGEMSGQTQRNVSLFKGDGDYGTLKGLSCELGEGPQCLPPLTVVSARGPGLSFAT